MCKNFRISPSFIQRKTQLVHLIICYSTNQWSEYIRAPWCVHFSSLSHEHKPTTSAFRNVFAHFPTPAGLHPPLERKKRKRVGRKEGRLSEITWQKGGAKFPYLASLGGVNRHNWGLSSSLTQTAVRLLSSPLFFTSSLGTQFVHGTQRVLFVSLFSDDIDPLLTR